MKLNVKLEFIILFYNLLSSQTRDISLKTKNTEIGIKIQNFVKFKKIGLINFNEIKIV